MDDIDLSRRSSLLLPAGLVVAAAATAAAGAPGYAAGPLTAAAAVTTVLHLGWRPDREPLDIIVRAVGGLILALVALGFLLDVVPGGLTRVSWSVAAGVAALAALADCLRRPAPPRVQLAALRGSLPGAVWYVLAAAVLGAAFTITVRATDRSERPPLALSVTSADTDSAEVAISAGTTGGSYDLLVGDGTTAGTVQGPFTVAAGASVEHQVVLPAGERVTIALVAPGTSLPLRSLVLQGPGPLRTQAPAPVATTPAPAPSTPGAPAPSQPALTTTAPVQPTTPAPVHNTPTPVLGPAAPLSTVPVGP